MYYYRLCGVSARRASGQLMDAAHMQQQADVDYHLETMMSYQKSDSINYSAFA